jgi:cytochrome c oxidase assembly factor CtaG
MIVLAHTETGSLAAIWEWSPAIAVPLVATALVYIVALRRRQRPDGENGEHHPWQRLSFAAGWLVTAIALVSPLHQAGERSLTAHMVQHILLIGIAAPLLVLGRPAIMASVLSREERRQLFRIVNRPVLKRAWHILAHPLVAMAFHGITIWLWHAPRLFDLAVRHRWVHALEHASFLGTALLFWWSMLLRSRRQHGEGLAIIALFITTMHSGLLGAALALSERPWYASYATRPDALADQQLAGLLMWIPAGATYIIAALALGALILEEKTVTLGALR